jgi:hypothetical protein
MLRIALQAGGLPEEEMKKTLRLLASGCAVLVACVCLIHAADAVEPASVTTTNLRGESASLTVSAESFYQGTTLLFTNCALYASTTTNAGLQGLDGVTVELRIGTTVASTAYSASVQSTNGLWWCSATVPTNMTAAFVQVKITDANTNSFIYPWKTLLIQEPLD